MPKATTKESPGFNEFAAFVNEKAKNPETLTPEEREKLVYFKSVMGEIFSTENIGIRTNITPSLVLPMAVAQSVSKFLGGNDVIDQFLYDISLFSISKGARSRNDMVDIAKGLYPQESQNELEQRTYSDRLLGKRR